MKKSKILWLINIIPPEISEKMGMKVNPIGGWIVGLLGDIVNTPEIELIVCFGQKISNRNVVGYTETYKYIGFYETGNDINTFYEILNTENPDIIHIWGTESQHSYDMVQASIIAKMTDKVVINIQGLLSVIAEYHYYCHLPHNIIYTNRLVEIKYGHRLFQERDEVIEEGNREKQTLTSVNKVIGRTDWDEASVKMINPKIKYYRCNETLRHAFYTNIWNYSQCEKHSIFFGQPYWPAKGLHIMIQALSMIHSIYPDAKLYVIGETPLEAYKTFKKRIRQRTYPRYLAQLIIDNNLEENVIFMGKQNEQQMCEKYLKSNVFVSASSIENSSNSIGEAMLLGMPVVASDVGGVKNFMEHEKEGYLYQSDAPYMLAYYVCKVFEDEDKAIQMGQRARQHALKSYDRENNLKQMISIYNQIVGE